MIPRNRQWTEADAEAVLNRADGARSDREFALQHGVTRQRLAWWRKRLDRPRSELSAEPSTPSSSEEFVEVVERPSGEAEYVEVLLRNGRQLRVPVTIEPDDLARLAAALEA